jgi:hypothetical protein
MASLIARFLTVIVPVILLLIPALKIAPSLYRWRMESRIYRWYRVLQEVEHDALKYPGDLKRLEALLRRLDHIEHTVNKIVVPPSCGYLFYGLREHISFIRASLHSQYLVISEQNTSASSIIEADNIVGNQDVTHK